MTFFRLIPKFIEHSRATEIEESLRNELAWEQRSVTIYGKTYPEPRLIAWTGDLPYTYSGNTLEPRPMGELLGSLLDEVSKAADAEFNHILINRYRNGNDSIGFHSDNEPELGKNPIVCSLSFGVSRTFILKRNKQKNEEYRCVLSHGDLLVMGENCQSNFKHGIPKEPGINGERISLTFRKIIEK